MKALVCMVIGDRSVFVMGIDERKKVGILKDMIKEKNSYSLPGKDLTLYLAKKGSNRFKTDDPDVLQFKEGVVTTVISDMMKNQMDPSYRVRNTDAYAPDEDAAEDGEIHVLVKVPEAAVGTTALRLVRGSIANALSTMEFVACSTASLEHTVDSTVCSLHW
ncbi:hypothetical protein AM588_10009662 [Phytophthora nicotianae]|uniref:Crinkler effector protein N-terminal domain-containing protein n=1 Tax=Phytophthora nicotianae TaxID=4792 RepID=A0A0W8D4R2_PHYNI|nr:hypothetical protein AM588_10009662 [Phytophthora nicotianae]